MTWWTWLRGVVEETYESWRAHRTLRMGAGLAYYALFGIVPFLTLSFFMANLVFSTEEAQAAILEAVETVFPPDQADRISTVLAEALTTEAASGAVTGLVGLITLVVASGLVLAALQDAIDVIFEVPVQRGMSRTVKRRLFLFAVVLLLASSILVALVFESVLTGLLELLGLDRFFFGITELVFSTRLLTLALIVASIAFLYRTLPRRRPPWHTAAVGAVITAVTGGLATYGVSLYLRTVGSSSVEGAAGAILLLLTLVYVWSQVFLAGAELIRTLATAPPGGPDLESLSTTGGNP